MSRPLPGLSKDQMLLVIALLCLLAALSAVAVYSAGNGQATSRTEAMQRFALAETLVQIELRQQLPQELQALGYELEGPVEIFRSSGGSGWGGNSCHLDNTVNLKFRTREPVSGAHLEKIAKELIKEIDGYGRMQEAFNTEAGGEKWEFTLESRALNSLSHRPEEHRIEISWEFRWEG